MNRHFLINTHRTCSLFPHRTVEYLDTCIHCTITTSIPSHLQFAYLTIVSVRISNQR